jgi:hypothetical protein
MGEASVGIGTLESPETAARASSDAAPAPGTETGTPVPKTETNKAADPSHTGVDADPKKVSQETPAARIEEGDRGKLPLLLGWPPRVLREGEPLRLRLGPALVAKALLASFRKNGRTELPAPALARPVKPGPRT